MNYQLVVTEIVKVAADKAIKLASDNANNGIFEPLYLYFKRSTESQHGELLLIGDSCQPPNGFELAHGEGLRGHIPYEFYSCWVRERCGRLPILAWGDVAWGTK
mgnify:CR=1 FL=1|jgi:hypothetical protein